MENASNALIIAGGILVGVLIISLAVYLFADFGTTSAQIHKQQEVRQLEEFNSKFTVYEGRTDLTMHDIITITGYAVENNKYYSDQDEYYSEGNPYYITVHLKSSRGTTRNFENNFENIYNERLYDEQKNNNGIPITYSVEEIQINEKTGRVNLISFYQN